MSNLRIHVDEPLLRALRLRAIRTGTTAPAIARKAIEDSLLAGGRATAVRVGLEAAELVTISEGRAGEVDLEIADAITAAPGARGKVDEIIRALEASTAVVEVYGTTPDLRRVIRLALA